ncbi:MAG: cysteine--tRNA ligase [Candidatus Omnitrophica bacterium]|nr:cysteine--tRNA ligase [Candidatus Omnitrophota bacterium]
MKIYNTLTRKKDEFQPQAPGQVNLYTCGVTVYDHCHIGHARSLYIFEVIKRYLSFRGYRVRHIRNITDIDDKIIRKARTVSEREHLALPEAFEMVRETYIRSYREDLARLGIPRAEQEPLATENIPEMQEFIRSLIEQGYAYESEGNVYFSVRSFPDYGKLSGKKIDDLFDSVRIEADPRKRDTLDFALWKKAKSQEPSWESPWGSGRPGWHIECSVMSLKCLSTETIDIHGGGRDLVFPHHENELAQSEARTGRPFARFWIHHGLVTIGHQKMAKSAGNFVTIREVCERFPADALKLLFLQAHYASSVDFSWRKMEEMKSAYGRIVNVRDRLEHRDRTGKKESGAESAQRYRQKFIGAMDDDFNMPEGLAALFELVNECHRRLDQEENGKDPFLDCAEEILREMCDVFCFTFEYVSSSTISEREVESMIREREKMRKEKKYEEADAIREELDAKGVILEDTKHGTVWRRKI